MGPSSDTYSIHCSRSLYGSWAKNTGGTTEPRTTSAFAVPLKIEEHYPPAYKLNYIVHQVIPQSEDRHALT